MNDVFYIRKWIPYNIKELTVSNGTLITGTPAAISFSTWVMLILLMWLVWLKLLSGTKTELAKKTSFVGALKTGASNANPEPNVLLTAICLTKAFFPRTERKSGWKTWKNGVVLLVGLNNEALLLPCRNVAF